MADLNHTNIVRMLAICSREPIQLVTELMPGGGLRTYLAENKPAISVSQLLEFIIQVCAVLDGYHEGFSNFYLEYILRA